MFTLWIRPIRIYRTKNLSTFALLYTEEAFDNGFSFALEGLDYDGKHYRLGIQWVKWVTSWYLIT